MNTTRSLTVAVVLLLAALPAHSQLRLPGAPGGGLPPAPGGLGGGIQPVPPAAAEPPARAGAAAQPAGPRPVDRIVAVVNQEAITESELEQRVRTITRRLGAQGAQLPPPDELRRQVLERMVVDRAQLQAAREAGVRIDEPTIDRAIARLVGDNKMTLAQLRARLDDDGIPFSTFRREIAQEIAVTRLRERAVDSRVQVSEAEVDALLAEQAEPGDARAEFDIVQVAVRLPENPPQELVERQRRLADEIAAELRQGADPAGVAARFKDTGQGVEAGALGMRPADRLPPLFVQAVERLRPGEVAPIVRSPAGFHVLKLLDRSGGGLAALAAAPVEQTRVRHILLRVDDVNPEAEALRRLREIRERIVGGTASFADMARQYSGDGSARDGGNLGWVYPGDTVPEFERAMAALQPDQVSGPVRTPFGYHLIQVLERRTDEASPERLRAAARNMIRERKASEAYEEWLRQVRDRAYVEYRIEDR
jgi:peptidyl-prolyl cis-trans isomerase SurA